jgi:hypothetical protein
MKKKRRQMESRNLTDFNVAGFTYYDGADVFAKLSIGTRLRLVAEPNNQYDGRAVALYYKSKKIGFVPRNENAVISKFLSLGYKDIFQVIVNRLWPTEYPESQVGVVVKVRRR